jgi:long-chain acyl-CoA synthetase
MEITKKTIIDNIQDRSDKNLNVTAFESLGGSSIDYKTFFEMIDVYAKAFLEIGVQNGDMVSICSGGTLDTMLNFAALNRIGATVQFVNPNYLKTNGKKYINDTNTKLLICMDRFYPIIKEELEKTNIKKILVSSLSEYSSLLYKIILKRKKIKNEYKIPNVEYIDLPDFIKIGENSNIKIKRIPYEKDKPAVIAYTSGTTGDPKGIVHTNDSINNMISIYAMTNGFGPGRGDRNLVLIPPMYLTSFVHSLFGTMILGPTNILQPIYDATTLGKNLKKYEPITVIASKAHYINLQNSNLKEGSLSFLKYPYCGGEAFSKTTAMKINKILEYYGIPPMILGYGQSEFGTMTMFNSDIETRTNESGILIPEIEAKILDLKTNKPVEKGQRGELYIKTPAVMKEYLNNPEATNKFFVIDEQGKKWGKTGDIAAIIGEHNGKDVYEVFGRKTDSFINSKGEIVYLFDIENEIEKIKFVKEAEIISLEIENENVPIAHIILDSKYNIDKEEAIKYIDIKLKETFSDSSYIPYAYKIREKFETSALSGKRDYNSLKFELNDFYRFNDKNELEMTNLKSKTKVIKK